MFSIIYLKCDSSWQWDTKELYPQNIDCFSSVQNIIIQNQKLIFWITVENLEKHLGLMIKKCFMYFFSWVFVCGGKYMICNRHLGSKLHINPLSKRNEWFALVIHNLETDFYFSL